MLLFYLALSVVVASSVAAGPCDLYASGGTPCVAAHSTTRALYSAYTGSLYQVKRGSDNTTTIITPLAAGGVANAADQDTFCASTTCLITVIYDQTDRGNHLLQAPPGGFSGPDANGYDNLASATGAPVTLNGQNAYGVFVSPGTGYRNNVASGTARQDAAQGMYAVLDGTHYNDGCCFDYGNAETNSRDNGDGHMEAIYYGANKVWGTGAGDGPWIMADLENGLFSGQGAKQNTADPPIAWRFVTAIVKGTAGQWAIRGADAAGAGTGAGARLATYYRGARPAGYDPMKKEGAILLGIGGDNSVHGQGTFYEGALTSGYPADATEDAVQADVAAARYAAARPRGAAPGAALAPGAAVALRASTTTAGAAARYLARAADDDADAAVGTQVVSAASAAALRRRARWTVAAALGGGGGGAEGCVALAAADAPGRFLRHANFSLRVAADDGTRQMREDATFCPEPGVNGQGVALRSWSYPTRYLRHYANGGYVASNGGVHVFDAAASFNDDVSWVLSDALA